MSFGFSVSDTIATAQLCHLALEQTFSTIGDSSKTSLRAVQALRQLITSLDALTDGLTSKESNTVLVNEDFQIPLRDGFSQIRRDVEAFLMALPKQTHGPKSYRLWALKQTMNREFEACIDRISEDNAKLQILLSMATLAIDNTYNQNILLSIETLAATSLEEDSEISQWLVGSENEKFHIALVSKREGLTGSWILEDPGYQKWSHSRNSLLWLWGMRTSPFPYGLCTD